MTRVAIPFKDQNSANFLKTPLKDLSLKITNYSPTRLSVEKLAKTSKNARPNQSWLMNNALCTDFNVTCAIQVAMLASHVAIYIHVWMATKVRHFLYASSMIKTTRVLVPEDFLSCFRVLKKCMNKLDCLVNEMLYSEKLRPRLNVQTDSIRAKVFV